MVLSQYGYDQCIPTTAGLNRVEDLVQDQKEETEVEREKLLYLLAVSEAQLRTLKFQNVSIVETDIEKNVES